MTVPSWLLLAAAEFAARARTAGHPVLAVAPGRWTGTGHTTGPSMPLGDLAPNDLLDVARESARSRADWVHAVLPTGADAVRLAAAVRPAIRPARPVGSRRSTPGRAPWRDLLHRASGPGRSGDPRLVPFEQLVAEIPLSVTTHAMHHDGRAVHVVEIPAAWLACPLTEVPR
jgi:hypothetical protein